MPSRLVLDEQIKAHLLDQKSLPSELRVGDKVYTPVSPVKAGFKGAIWRAKDEYGRDRALKLAIREDYADRSYLSEMAYAAKLERYEEFARIDHAAMVKLKIQGSNVPFVCFVEEWIQGDSLADFLIADADEVTASFLVNYVSFATRALQALSQERLRHDDLHSKNVMITAPSGRGVLADRKFKIVDLGSLKPLDQPTKKDRDDHENFVGHLVDIWNVVYGARALPVRDRRFLQEAKNLLKLMLETDPSIALRDPEQILVKFKEADVRCTFPAPTGIASLNSPFEFLSAEHIADDRVLVGIFAKSCPWLPKVASRDPCLLTGPRGCGKSTIMRWLSLKAHLHLDNPDLEALQISGFYISCSSELQNRLGWIRSRALAEKFEKAIIHFFNMMLTRELLFTLELISKRPDRVSRWGFGAAQEETISDFLDGTVGKPVLRLQGLPRITQIRERVDAEIFATHSEWLVGRIRDGATPKSFVGDLTAHLVKLMPYFLQRPIVFLIDDFSVHRIPTEVQTILNRIIWERRSSHIFKLSAEKYGATLSDEFDATAEQSRELVEIDCGKEFIALDDHAFFEKSLTFARELLDNRLARAGYQGSAEQIIGHSSWREGSLAKALVEKKSGGRGGQYHGLECISQLCSGDVSTLLMIFRRIFELGNVDKNTVAVVNKTTQDRAIRETSRKLVDGIRTYFPHGPAMHTLTNAFGNLVRRILNEGKWQSTGRAKVPTQCPRIEIDQGGAAVVDTLTNEQRNLATEIVRRSIFIEMDVGLSRHQSVTTLRWHFRRVFLPNFGAALAKNDAIKKKPDWFKFFLTSPVQACEIHWSASPKRPSSGKKRRKRSDDDDQGSFSLN